jgi:hypothetical protein
MTRKPKPPPERRLYDQGVSVEFADYDENEDLEGRDPRDGYPVREEPKPPAVRASYLPSPSR